MIVGLSLQVTWVKLGFSFKMVKYAMFATYLWRVFLNQNIINFEQLSRQYT